MIITVTDRDLATLSTALAVFFVGQLDVQLAPFVERLEAIERRYGIEPSTFDAQSVVTVDEVAAELRAAIATALVRK